MDLATGGGSDRGVGDGSEGAVGVAKARGKGGVGVGELGEEPEGIFEDPVFGHVNGVVSGALGEVTQVEALLAEMFSEEETTAQVGLVVFLLQVAVMETLAD